MTGLPLAESLCFCEVQGTQAQVEVKIERFLVPRLAAFETQMLLGVSEQKLDPETCSVVPDDLHT